ncbi:protein kinase [bacterium]|nr:protein kinase [bacterium]
MAVLLLKSHEGEALEVPLERKLVIGRGSLCDLRLRDDRVSRRHAQIYTRDDAVIIRDLDSRNGTWVNRRNVRKARLAYGDEIVVGCTRLIFTDQAPSKLVGEQFGGYRMDEQIGSGGMGVVYRATHITTDRVVAVKVLHPRLVADRRFVERFLREAHAARTLQHPNVVKVFEGGRTSASYYYAMEFIDGPTVAEELRKQGPYDPDIAIGIAIEIASALAYAHAQGIVHRDVKPENIMIAPDAKAKLADLGLAKFVAAGEHDLEHGPDGRPRIWGTPAYISPEAALGRDTDGRSDLYSLGATLYQMLTGCAPFAGGTVTEVLSQHVHQPLPSLQNLAPDLPHSLSDVLEKLMAKQPERRYQTGDELIADLNTVRTDIGQAVSSQETRVAPRLVPAPPEQEPGSES